MGVGYRWQKRKSSLEILAQHPWWSVNFSLSSLKDLTDHLSITLLRSSLGTWLSQAAWSTKLTYPSRTTLASFSFPLFYSELLFALSFTSLHLFIIQSTSLSPYFLPLSITFNLYTLLTRISQVYQRTQGLAAVHIPHKKQSGSPDTHTHIHTHTPQRTPLRNLSS